MKMIISTWRNKLDYPLRKIFRWRRPGLQFQNESKDDLFNYLEGMERLQAEETVARLLKDYRLQHQFAKSKAINYRENLFYLEMMIRALDTVSSSIPSEVIAADVGPSHWFYVQALHTLLKWWQSERGREVTILGYEIDAYRVYTDLYSRFDHAVAHIRGLEGVRYIPSGFERQSERFHVVFNLFPFVLLRDHLEWGLPQSLFNPEELMADILGSLKPAGVLIIVNQGFNEHQVQQEILNRIDVRSAATFRHDSLLFRYDLPRYVSVVIRDD